MRISEIQPNQRRAEILAAALALLLANCSGPDGDETVTLTLDSDASCYGVEIQTNDEGSGELSCTPGHNVIEGGCVFTVHNDPANISIRGCRLPGGTTMFTCTAPSGLITKLNDADVRCGCGCAEDCPTSPSVKICNVDDAFCQNNVASRVDASPAGDDVSEDVQRSSDAQVVTTTSSTLFCGTCCDVFSEPEINLQPNDAFIHELEFEVSLPASSEPGCPSIDCNMAARFDGPARQVRLSRNRVRICGSAKSAVPGRIPLVADCSVESGGDVQFTFSNVKALDDDLRPIVPALGLVQVD